MTDAWLPPLFSRVDVPLAAECISYYGEAIDKVYDEIAPTGPDDVVMLVREPLGVVGAVIGFFVIPGVGLPIGFVVGVLVSEYLRYRDWDRAWSATKAALRGVLHSMGIELGAALLIAITWTVGILAH